MKILLKVFNAGTGIEAAFVDVTPEYARWLLSLRELWHAMERSEALKETNPQYSLNFSLFEHGATYIGSTDGDWAAAVEEIDNEEVLELIYAGETPLLPPYEAAFVEREHDWEQQPTEADCITVDDVGVGWTARPRHGDDQMETATLEWRLVEIAAQQPEVSGE